MHALRMRSVSKVASSAGERVGRGVPRGGVPHAHGRVEPARRDAHAVERDGVDLVEVPAEDVQARAAVDVPHAARAVVAPAHDARAARVEAAHALRVALEHAQQAPALDVPHAQRAVARARDRERPPVQDLEAPDRRCVPAEGVDAISTGSV